MDRRRTAEIATNFGGSTFDGRGSEVHSVWRTAHTGTIRYTTSDGEVRVARESYDTWTDNASAELVGAIERWEDVQAALADPDRIGYSQWWSATVVDVTDFGGAVGVDSFPVHRVERRAGGDIIAYVRRDEDGRDETDDPRIVRRGARDWHRSASPEFRDAAELWEARIGGTDADEGDEPIAAEGIPAGTTIDRQAVTAEVILDLPRHIAVPLIAALLAAGTDEQR